MVKSLNILVINWQDSTNPLAGGAEVHLHEVFERIAARGHKVTLLCHHFKGAPREENRNGIRIIRHGGRFLFNFHVPFQYRRRFRREGFDVVVDLAKSKGSYLVDARTGKRYLDFFTFVASHPLGMNHPKLASPAFLKKLTRGAVTKPSLSDIYTQEQAEFVATFARVAKPDYLPHAFFIEGGALGVENTLKAAFDWKIRKNFARGIREERGRQIIHFRQAFHGRSGYTLSLTNTDPVKTDLFPSSPGRGSSIP